MTKIRFYHLEQKTLGQALPEMLGKALSIGHKIIVKTADAKQVQHINDHLWSFVADSFIPHGTEKEGHAAEQPIWITDNDNNPNEADVLILTDGAISDDIEKYELCCEMLDGRNPEAVSAARARWKEYKEKGFEISYWQQDETGRWQNKA